MKTKGAGTCDAIRAAVPWLEVALALANPPESVECLDCGDVVKFDELYDGRCEDCDRNYFYCCICDERQHRDHLCYHLEWSSSASEEVGTGSGSDDIHKESFDRLLGVLGLRRARKLRAAIANKSWFGGGHYRLEERVEALREKASDTNDRDGTEVGLIWLSTLGDADKLKPCVEKTLAWIDEHLAARKARIAADPRPRRVLRDGQRRYYVQRTDTWTSIREHASWMRAPAARRLVELLREVYPKAVVKVVHVLTPHQKVTR